MQKELKIKVMATCFDTSTYLKITTCPFGSEAIYITIGNVGKLDGKCFSFFQSDLIKLVSQLNEFINQNPEASGTGQTNQ